MHLSLPSLWTVADLAGGVYDRFMTASLDFASFAPTLPTVPLEQRKEFFETAPGGTVVEFGDGLYQRADFGDRWLGLHDVAVDHTFGSPSAAYEKWTPETILALAEAFDGPVFVVRVGGSRS